MGKLLSFTEDCCPLLIYFLCSDDLRIVFSLPLLSLLTFSHSLTNNCSRFPHSLVKLADFGVAIKINSDGANSGPSGGMEDNPDLAGSPYWMAPEIIEMSTPTSACDIW